MITTVAIGLGKEGLETTKQSFTVNATSATTTSSIMFPLRMTITILIIIITILITVSPISMTMIKK